MKAFFDGRLAAAEIRHREAVSLAWHVERMARVKKLPKLAKLLATREGPKEQTGSEMLAVLTAMRDAGAPITIRKREREQS